MNTLWSAVNWLSFQFYSRSTDPQHSIRRICNLQAFNSIVDRQSLLQALEGGLVVYNFQFYSRSTGSLHSGEPPPGSFQFYSRSTTRLSMCCRSKIEIFQFYSRSTDDL